MMWWDMLDGTSMLHCMGTFLISLVLFRVKVSLIMTPFGFLADSVVDRTTLTFLGSGSVPIVMLRGVGQCVVTATGVEHPGQVLLLLLLLGTLDVPEGVAEALWVEILLLDLAMCRPRLGNRVSCLLVVRQVLGSELHRKIPILLCYLESCLARSSFFRRSCLQRTSPSMRSWWLLLLKKKGPRNVSSCFGKKCNRKTGCESKRLVTLNKIAELEADAEKQRAMLQSVREELEAVNDEVCALRALVADPSVPTGPAPEPPPLPAPRTPPPSSQDLLDIATPLDEDMDDCENEEDLEWPPVRRFSRVERRNKIGVIKGFTKHRQEKRLPATKHVILEDDMLTENIGKDQSGKEIADMLCNMPHEKLLEVVQNCPASMLQQFVPNVSPAMAAAVVENQASSSG